LQKMLSLKLPKPTKFEKDAQELLHPIDGWEYQTLKYQQSTLPKQSAKVLLESMHLGV